MIGETQRFRAEDRLLFCWPSPFNACRGQLGLVIGPVDAVTAARGFLYRISVQRVSELLQRGPMSVQHAVLPARLFQMEN
jgi:hypothetical protein